MATLREFVLAQSSLDTGNLVRDHIQNPGTGSGGLLSVMEIDAEMTLLCFNAEIDIDGFVAEVDDTSFEAELDEDGYEAEICDGD